MIIGIEMGIILLASIAGAVWLLRSRFQQVWANTPTDPNIPPGDGEDDDTCKAKDCSQPNCTKKAPREDYKCSSQNDIEKCESECKHCRCATGVCPTGGSSMNSASVGDAGGPNLGEAQVGMGGYTGGWNLPRWKQPEVALAAIGLVAHGDMNGNVAVSQRCSAVQLKFASGQEAIGPVGWNWSHEYQRTLIQRSSTIVAIQHRGGRWDRYSLVSSVWTPEAGRRGSLVKNGDGTWTETAPLWNNGEFPRYRCHFPQDRVCHQHCGCQQ